MTLIEKSSYQKWIVMSKVVEYKLDLHFKKTKIIQYTACKQFYVWYHFIMHALNS